jgi:hypothetical protein
MKSQQKLEHWAEREVKRNLHNMIVDIDKDNYVVFGKYYLCLQHQSVSVHSLGGDLIGKFGNKRTAISWCVADNKNMLSLAQNIKNLDRKKSLLSADIHCRRSAADRSRQQGFSEMVLTKLQTKIEQHTMVDRELEKCLNLAKYIQLRGFQNETARTSGHQAN